MGEKIVVGPFNRGLNNSREPFNIDNDSFPVLINAYQWRGRIKRKRGTKFLTRLQRSIGTTDAITGNLVVTISPIPIPTGKVSFKVGSNIFTDPGTTANPGVQVLLTNGPGTATLDRVNGILNIAASNLNTEVIYFPTLPVMGLEELNINANAYPGQIAFDTRYAYDISTNAPYNNHDVSFYKNPPADPINLPGYVQKVSDTTLYWNGQDYQQFGSVNYQGALWVTNGINIPFNGGVNVGMQFKPIVTVTVGASGPPADITLQITGHGLVVGDFIFVNEVVTTTGINFQTGYVTAVFDANNIGVRFPNATITTNGTGGIAQYLTNTAVPGVDPIRWYDGDPTVSDFGWVNFSPPLSEFDYSIADLPPRKYYLVGARIIQNFKDRLLFFGPVVQASTGGKFYLQDTIIYSQNGTPYYTTSYTNTPSPVDDNPTSPTNVYFPILLPDNQTSTAPTWFEDQTGFGGFITAGFDQKINSVASNQDVLITGFDSMQTRVVYTQNDIVPFNFYTINSELGTSSVFSAINLDQGVISRGNRGYIITNQTGAQRIDTDIPDEVFEIRLSDNGAERITSQRDYIKEWIYESYPSNEFIHKFPTRTLQYNYRDNSWAIFNESFTTYGTFKPNSGYTWATLVAPFTWKSWTTPWNSGSSNLLQPIVIAGNSQGFVVFRTDDTQESDVLYIQNMVNGVVTSPNHCLNEGDFITISGVLGADGSIVNDKIFSVGPPVTADSFTLNPLLATGTYVGGGLIKRMYIPFIQTKQFPVSWAMSRKTRIGPQQYLLTTTNRSQITLQIYLSQNADYGYNSGTIVPSVGSDNNGLIYSSVLYTCTESSNLGLTPANTNLQMISQINTTGTNASSPQQQIWHRVNTSLLGDTVQFGFTLSEEQMRTVDDDGQPISQFTEIELHGIIADVSPSQVLS